MAGRQYGFLGNRSGFNAGQAIFAAPIDVLTTGEKTPQPALFPPGFVISDVILHVIVAEATAATKTVDLGLLSTATAPDADADGFAVGISTAALGAFRPSLLVTATRGALLKETSTGGAVHVPKPWIITKLDTTFSYTLGSAHTELVADVYILGWRVPVPQP